MGKLLYLGIFLASLNPTYEAASDSSRRALLETDMMKTELESLQNETERTIFQYTGLTKDDLVYAGYAYPLLAGKISTKPFKNLKYETHNKYTIRPEIEYGIYSKEFSAVLVLTKEF